MSNEQSVLCFAQSHAQRMQCTFFGMAGYLLYVHSYYLAIVNISTHSCNDIFHVVNKVYCIEYLRIQRRFVLWKVYKLSKHTQAYVVSLCGVFQCLWDTSTSKKTWFLLMHTPLPFLGRGPRKMLEKKTSTLSETQWVACYATGDKRSGT